ncbi:hypothetical protein P9D43_20820 [Neobacillus niacini]|uniref:hypothetical protein n=1 Tax=Neobacillus niacini TaxID=86668 RepID=UPI0007ABA114|nr:hypothetical protein [Neobacillus niacini]MEC1524449.1 hypothetical protein [Neobacillus niacini]
MSLKNKYKRPTPDQVPPKKKGNSEVISKMVHSETINTGIQETVNTERKIKKATFELDAILHKKLRTFAALNDTTMVDIVEKAINEYFDRMEYK